MKTLYTKNKLSANSNYLSANLQDKLNLRSASAYDKIEFKTKNNLNQTKNDTKKSKILPNLSDTVIHL